MKKIVVFFGALLLVYAIQAQFSFSSMNNPDPDKITLDRVLISENQAWATSSHSLYYNGSSWEMTGMDIFLVSSVRKTNGDNLTVAYSYNNKLYKWLDSEKKWKFWRNFSSTGFTMNSYGAAFLIAYSENKIYLVRESYKDGVMYSQLVLFNGTKSVLLTPEEGYACSFFGCYVKNENDILILAKYPGESYILLRYIGNPQLEFVTSFPETWNNTPKNIWTLDGENFFIFGGGRNLYHWNDIDLSLSKIYYPNEDVNNSNYCLICYTNGAFSIDENNFFFYGEGGVLHFDRETGKTQVILDLSYIMLLHAAYENGRAIFVGYKGVIYEMLVQNSVPSEEIQRALKVYQQGGQLEIEFPVFGPDTKTVEVYDLQGRKISQTQLESFRASINVSAWDGGIYILRLKDASGYLASRKFLIE